jgi:ketosteroid isomerase-like protein
MGENLMRIPIYVAGLLCSAAAFSPVVAQSPSAGDLQLPSVSLPAELDRVLRDYERAWRSGDATNVAALFSIDGFVLQNGRAPVRGRAAIGKAYAGQAGGELRLRALGYAVADTVGYIIGAYTYGETPGDMGKWTLTLRRARGGRWEIFSDMDNGNQQRRQAAPSSTPVTP